MPHSCHRGPSAARLYSLHSPYWAQSVMVWFWQFWNCFFSKILTLMWQSRLSDTNHWLGQAVLRVLYSRWSAADLSDILQPRRATRELVAWWKAKEQLILTCKNLPEHLYEVILYGLPHSCLCLRVAKSFDQQLFGNPMEFPRFHLLLLYFDIHNRFRWLRGRREHNRIHKELLQFRNDRQE